MKKTLLAGLTCGVVIFGVAGVSQSSTIETIVNGNFEDGLNGWTVDNPDSHPFGIIDIDIDGIASLTSSNAFFTNTGGGFGSDDVNISQTVSLIAGKEYTFSADLASLNGDEYGNASGGQITASFEGDTIAIFDFGFIAMSAWEYGTLSSLFTASFSGSGLFNINIYRPYRADDTTPYQYIDNISLTYQSESTPVPEPATLLLMGTGIIGLFGVRRKKA